MQVERKRGGLRAAQRGDRRDRNRTQRRGLHTQGKGSSRAPRGERERERDVLIVDSHHSLILLERRGRRAASSASWRGCAPSRAWSKSSSARPGADATSKTSVVPTTRYRFSTSRFEMPHSCRASGAAPALTHLESTRPRQSDKKARRMSDQVETSFQIRGGEHLVSISLSLK